MSSNYPPGVTGSEPEITGDDGRCGACGGPLGEDDMSYCGACKATTEPDGTNPDGTNPGHSPGATLWDELDQYPPGEMGHVDGG
jgi:hypothetical protein